jgi:hypothetical protein
VIPDADDLGGEVVEDGAAAALDGDVLEAEQGLCAGHDSISRSSASVGGGTGAAVGVGGDDRVGERLQDGERRHVAGAVRGVAAPHSERDRGAGVGDQSAFGDLDDGDAELPGAGVEHLDLLGGGVVGQQDGGVLRRPVAMTWSAKPRPVIPMARDGTPPRARYWAV